MKHSGVVKLLSATAVLLCTGHAVAQPSISQSANPLVLVRQNFGDTEDSLGQALKIRSLDVTVDVVGASAITTMKVRFATPPRGQEADFNLDLPTGSVVTGYALDIQGKMVDGVIVAPRQATKAYEERVRRGVDPGLAKVTRSGGFNTRVFSARGESERTIEVHFVTPVGPDESYILPMTLADEVDALSITVRGSGLAQPMTIEGPARDLAVRKTGDAQFSISGREAVLAGSLRLTGIQPRSTLLTRAGNDELFFEALVAAKPTPVRTQGRVRVYWDGSRSRRDNDLTGELGLLASYLDSARPRAVDVVVFADGAPQRLSFSGPAMTAEIVRALGQHAYLGATSFKAAFSTNLPKADTCLLFSDGEATVDQSAPKALDCQMFSITSAIEAKRNVLSVIARMSGGEAIDLRAVSQAAALERLLHPRTRVIAARDDEGRLVDALVLPAGPLWRVIGRAPEAGDIILETAAGTQPLHLDRGQPIRSDGASVLWAYQKLGELAAQSAKPDRILEVARRYQVAGDGAMFVVLDTPQDYVDNDIAPPSAFSSEQREQYAQLLKAKRDADANAKAERMSRVLVAWNEEKAWWRNPIPRPPKPPKVIGSFIQPVPSPPEVLVPMPSPPPVVNARPAQDGEEGTQVEMVVVTGQRLSRSSVDTPLAVTAYRDATRERAAPGADKGSVVEIQAAAWDPDRPYLKAIKAEPRRFAEVFAEQEAAFGALPAFYFDVAEYLFRQGKAAQARTMALSAIELPTANATTYKILADRLMRYGDPDRAIWIYEHILDLEPDRPQPRRDLALALIDRASLPGMSQGRQANDLRQAISLLNEVVMTPWQGDYDGIELIALMEANAVSPRYTALTGERSILDPRLRAQMDVDLRVVLDWNTEHTDYDLWVDEPNRERVMYSHNRSASGGRISNDMTEGYGPEEYLLKTAPTGVYEVRADGYRADRFNPNGVTTIRARLYRNWGRPNQAVETFEVDLSQDDNEPLVGRFKVGKQGS